MEGHSRIMVATTRSAWESTSLISGLWCTSRFPEIWKHIIRIRPGGPRRQAAACTLLYDVQDKRIQQFFLARHHPGERNCARSIKAYKTFIEQAAVEFKQLHEAMRRFSIPGLQVILQLLEDGGIVGRDNQLGYRLEKKDAKSESHVDLPRLQAKAGHDRHALERMVFYAQSGFCRMKVLPEYFHEEVDWVRCGHCDNCLSNTN